MDLRSLRHIVILGRRLSFTKAAEELGLSQSALSRSIQAIEKSAQVKLFDRDRGGVHLTTVGRAFMERATLLLREADDLDWTLRQAARGQQGSIAYGMATLPAATLLSSVVSEGLTSNPTLRSHIAVRNADALLSLLLAEEIEFFVCAEGQVPDTAPVKSAFLGWFPLSLLVRVGHPLLVSPASARQKTFPLIVASPITVGRTIDPKRHPYIAGPPHIVLENYAALAQIMQTSDAIWLTSSFSMSDAISRGSIKSIPVSGIPRLRMLMYSLDRRTLSPAAVKLQTEFRTRIRALSEAVQSNR